MAVVILILYVYPIHQLNKIGSPLLQSVHGEIFTESTNCLLYSGIVCLINCMRHIFRRQLYLTSQGFQKGKGFIITTPWPWTKKTAVPDGSAVAACPRQLNDPISPKLYCNSHLNCNYVISNYDYELKMGVNEVDYRNYQCY